MWIELGMKIYGVVFGTRPLTTHKLSLDLLIEISLNVFNFYQLTLTEVDVIFKNIIYM